MTMVVEKVAERRNSDRVFFTGMSVASVLTVFAGFAPTYYLRGEDLPALPLLVHVHGIVFTSWFLLFVTQTALVSAQRTDIHRRLGIVAAVVAGLVVVVGTAVAIGALSHAAPFGMEPAVFLSIPMGDILAFGILVLAAIFLRRVPDAHKRLMLLGTITLLPAAFARIAMPFGAGVSSLFIFCDLAVAACVVYDLWSHGRVHPSLVAGGFILVVAKPLLYMASETPAWLALANALQ